MKRLMTIMFALLIHTMPAASFTEGKTDWAYAAMALNNADYGVGSIYYGSSCFTTEAMNPVTGQKYTEEELAVIVKGAKEGGKGYIKGLPAGAVLGMNVYGTEEVLWFDAEGAMAIIAHSDPLKLNAEAGTMTTMDGVLVATAMSR